MPRGIKGSGERRERAGTESKMPGAYVILFRLGDRTKVTVGRLGTYVLEAGSYAYVGSAMNGLRARTDRHLRGGTKKHWHIDHILPLSSERKALLVPSEVDIECRIAEIIQGWEGTSLPIQGFGSSDCHCLSHLFFMSEEVTQHLASRLSSCLGRQVIIVVDRPEA
jgi:Uri superfamily endonuclease